MARLIDANKLPIYTATHQELIMAIQDVPAEYDVDKVVNQLILKSFPDFEEEYSCNGDLMLFLSDAIKIVRNGGDANDW